MSKALGYNIIVENKPRAGGPSGAVELVNAEPDGYTFGQLPISVLRNPQRPELEQALSL